MTSASPTGAVGTASGPAASDPARWELVRALGAAVLTPPPASSPVWEGLGLTAPTGAQHTEVFVLAAPPHAAIHLGAEGQLGGEGLDRVAGFWRALGLKAPEDADHLGTLLLLYAEIGVAETASDDLRRDQLRRTRWALLHEHLWSWAPGYLRTVVALGVGPVAEWAEVTLAVLAEERAASEVPTLLPLALREAAEPLRATGSLDEALDVMVTPVRSGFVLTQRDLHRGARLSGVGLRRGERRYALQAMLKQDPTACLTWLLEHARSWTAVHALDDDGGGTSGPDPTRAWWRDRAQHSVDTLEQMLADPAPTS